MWNTFQSTLHCKNIFDLHVLNSIWYLPINVTSFSSISYCRVAVSCSPVGYRLGGDGFGFQMSVLVGRALKLSSYFFPNIRKVKNITLSLSSCHKQVLNKFRISLTLSRISLSLGKQEWLKGEFRNIDSTKQKLCFDTIFFWL